MVIVDSMSLKRYDLHCRLALSGIVNITILLTRIIDKHQASFISRSKLPITR